MADFDSRALTWDNDPRKVEMAKKIAYVIKTQIPTSKQMTAYEYGCGTGLLSFNLYPFLKSIKMVDISDGMLDVLREKVKNNKMLNVEIEKADLTENFKPHESYDLVYTQMTLHHIIDIEKLIGVFYQMINPPGYLCIADLDEEDGTFHAADFKGHNGFNQEKLIGLLKKTGFVNIKNEIGFEITKLASDGITKNFPVFVISAQKELEK